MNDKRANHQNEKIHPKTNQTISKTLTNRSTYQSEKSTKIGENKQNQKKRVPNEINITTKKEINIKKRNPRKQKRLIKEASMKKNK
jgi:hypothetical protein